MNAGLLNKTRTRLFFTEEEVGELAEEEAMMPPDLEAVVAGLEVKLWPTVLELRRRTNSSYCFFKSEYMLESAETVALSPELEEVGSGRETDADELDADADETMEADGVETTRKPETSLRTCLAMAAALEAAFLSALRALLTMT